MKALTKFFGNKRFTTEFRHAYSRGKKAKSLIAPQTDEARAIVNNLENIEAKISTLALFPTTSPLKTLYRRRTSTRWIGRTSTSTVRQRNRAQFFAKCMPTSLQTHQVGGFVLSK